MLSSIERQLFKGPGLPVIDYNTQVVKIQPMDILVFSDGRRFTIHKRLDVDKTGSRVMVFDIGNGKVLRIPNRSDRVYSIRNYRKGYRLLKRSALSDFVVRIYPEQSSRAYEYIIAEKVAVKFLLADYLKDQQTLINNRRIFEKDLPLTQKRLLEFAEASSEFSKIGDLSPQQIAWDGEKWILFDWKNSHKISHTIQKPFAFEERILNESGFSHSLCEEFRQALVQARKRFASSGWSARSLVERLTEWIFLRPLLAQKTKSENYLKVKQHTKPITRRSHHEKVLQILSCLPRGKVLDIPCGHGALTEQLLKMGFDISCADIDPGLFQLNDILVKTCNLNEAIPFGDESFDIVVSVAGVHRLHSPAIAIREMYRVLRKNGTLIVSFPNYAHLRRRIKFLFRGYIARGIILESFHQTITDADANFRNILLYPQMKKILERVGFFIKKIEADRRPRMVWLYGPIVLLIWAVTMLVSEKNKGNLGLLDSNSSRILLGGYNLIIVATK